MLQSKLAKLMLFNIILVLVNVLLFSKAFLNINLFGGNAFLTALGVTVIVVSVLLFFSVNRRILAKPEPRPRVSSYRDPNTLADCSAAARLYTRQNVKTFEGNLRDIVSQIERFEKKKETIRDVLLEKFSDGEMSFLKFDSAVESVEKLMLEGTRSFLNRINAFDEGEYETLIQRNKIENRFQEVPLDPLMQSRMDIYNEYIQYGKNAVENNERILIRMDQLILEITKLNTLNEGDIEQMDAMRDISSLISEAKWYK